MMEGETDWNKIILRDYITIKMLAYSEELHLTTGIQTGHNLHFWNNKKKNELAIKAAEMLNERPIWDDEIDDIKWLPIGEWERIMNQ